MTKIVDLRLFLKDWLAWATSGDTETPSPEGALYNNRFGLCSAAFEYSGITDRNLPPGCLEAEALQSWLGFTSLYPFGRDEYYVHLRRGSQHLDPARLAWVRNKIADLENVPEEPKPDTALNGQPTGRDQELEDMRAINIALLAEIDALKKRGATTSDVTVPGPAVELPDHHLDPKPDETPYV